MRTFTVIAASFTIMALPSPLEASKPLEGIAPIEQALTLAQIRTAKGLETILVLEETDTGPGPVGDVRRGLNLSALYQSYPEDPLFLVAEIGPPQLRAAIRLHSEAQQEFDAKDFVVSPAIGSAHVAAGTNYRAHGEEAGIDEVFLFPKFSPPAPPVTSVAAPPGALLDYEIEICVRFDRDVASRRDFSEALKGIFLCGDYTDRASLMRRVDPDDVASGRGFSDAKSGGDRFPVGPYTVVPEDWAGFLEGVRMRLWVNGEVRQDAAGSEMIKKLNEIVGDSLDQGDEQRWSFRDKRIRLIEEKTIRKGQAVLTGTPEGVVFRQPTTAFKFWNGAEWLFTLGFFDSGPVDYVIEAFIAAAQAEKSYLQPGDRVEMEASYLGSIEVTITD